MDLPKEAWIAIGSIATAIITGIAVTIKFFSMKKVTEIDKAKETIARLEVKIDELTDKINELAHANINLHKEIADQYIMFNKELHSRDLTIDVMSARLKIVEETSEVTEF